MWPIKWKEILYRITIWNRKMSQYNSLVSAFKIDLIFFYFEDYSKSARGMILFLLVTYSYIPILLKKAEKPTVIWLSAENFFKSTVQASQKESKKGILSKSSEKHRVALSDRIFYKNCSHEISSPYHHVQPYLYRGQWSKEWGQVEKS